MRILELFPPDKSSSGTNLPFDWKTVQKITDNLKLNLGICEHLESGSSSLAFSNSLALEYVANYLGKRVHIRLRFCLVFFVFDLQPLSFRNEYMYNRIFFMEIW